ncbi:hypothetical protein GWK41_09940 [Persephonella atlantica]|uniref:Chemotaxis methyl-accepting receptor HlyB-like 4HB MCP domain-containing protein n=1 Tax=Persephonella atlantica TaxID=2699429 RepID=A0ABS1GKA8_9AQUI|nr:hypothetical protein [Persephonella atlantica]MBK3333384.1 hypothetical protein [Persephonella atlantica]
MDIKTVIAYQYKKIVLIALLVVVGFGFYKVYSSFFEKVNQIWQMKIGYDYANLIALAEQKLKNAQFQVEWSCSDFSLEDKHTESESCRQAKKELAKAKEEYAKLQAEKDKLFKIENQVKSYYDAVLLAAQQTPLPFTLLVITLVSFIIIVGLIIKEFLPSKR